MARLQMGHEQIAVQQHSGQQVVEVVSHASGQTADGFESLGLPQTLLGLVVLAGRLRPGPGPSRLAVRARHAPCGPAYRPAICARRLRIDLKTVALPREQFRQQSFRFGPPFGMNEVSEAERLVEPGPSPSICSSVEIQRDDVARALALRQRKRGVFKKRTQFRFRILAEST